MIAERLKDLRLTHGFTQAYLSKELHIGQATIACYENGTREPHISILSAYADFFQCSVDFLIGREDEFGNISIGEQKNAELSPDEKELLDLFKTLDPLHQKQVIGYVQGFAQRAHPAKYFTGGQK